MTEPNHDDPTAVTDAAGVAAVKPAAIAVIAVGALGALASIASLACSRFALQAIRDQANLDATTKSVGELMYGSGALVFFGIGLLVSLLALAGGVSMLRMKSREFGYVGAIAGMIVPSCCCCVAGLPIGIWAIVVLGRDEVKGAFLRRA